MIDSKAQAPAEGASAIVPPAEKTGLRPPEAECIDESALGQAPQRRALVRMEVDLTVEGDRVVITAGTAVNIPGSTNVIKVEVA